MHFEHCFIWQVPSRKDLLVHLSTFDMVLLWQIQFAPVAWKNFIIIFIINPLCAIFSFQMRWKKCNKDMNYDTYFSKEFWKMHYFSLHIIWVVCKSFENLTKCRVQGEIAIFSKKKWFCEMGTTLYFLLSIFFIFLLVWYLALLNITFLEFTVEWMHCW